jgi:DNA-binding protein H-NS
MVRCFWRFQMAKTSLASMSVEALLKLRDDIGTILKRKVDELQSQLSLLGYETNNSRLGHETDKKRHRASSLKGRRVAVKYRDRSGNTWAGRGAQPVWLREKLKAGGKLEDFAVHKGVAPGNHSKKRRKK